MTTPRPSPERSNSLSRRKFIGYSAAAASALAFPAFVRGQNLNNKLNVAIIGAGGKGASDTDSVAQLGENIYALCDVDSNTLKKRGEKYSSARQFRDYRKMLTEIGDKIDAVVVATPDHHHAFAASMVIQGGVIGMPLELHVWCNRPIWPQGIDRPAGEDPVPENLDWDQWIGPAKMRPYKGGRTYHDFNWRGWRDFGTGALGDMACHTVNMPFRALKLGYPTVVECEATSDNHAETYPKASRIRFEFPSREGLPPVKFWWYDGNPSDKQVPPMRPNEDVTKEIVEMRGSMPTSGCLIIGDKGKVFSPDDYGSQFFFMQNGEKGFVSGSSRTTGEHPLLKAIPQSIPRSTGHYKEWVQAIRGGNAAYSNFDIAAYLTEIILLGCVAMKVGVGKRMDWDGPAMKAKNVPEAARFVKDEYRAGWTI
jgi:predicted dehydrogenase